MQVQSNNNQRVKKYYVYGHYTNKGLLYYIGVGTILNLKKLYILIENVKVI